MRDAVIVGYARSPFTRANKGALARTRADQLAADVVGALIARTGVDPGDIEDLIVGCALPEGEQGLNIGRIAGFLAHLPLEVGGGTVNRFCGSSMSAVHMAAGAVGLGAGEAFVCAGVESMTRVPILGFNPLPHPRLAETYPQAYISMGQTAENVARRYEIAREAQEAFALASHRKATAAREAGRFADEIVPIATEEGTVAADDGIRPDTTKEQLAALDPAFGTDGTVTAGTSSPLTDGAAAVLVCSGDYAARHGLPVLARIAGVAVAGCAPELMGLGPVYATRKALRRAGLELAEMDVVEINEAFAAQVLACAGELGLDLERSNLDGGAIALGHPLGASGARITGKAAALLAREGGRHALATMCIGGGQGIATVLEAP